MAVENGSPLAPHKLDTARAAAGEYCAKMLRQEGGDLAAAKDATWHASKRVAAVRMALARVFVASCVVLADPETGDGSFAADAEPVDAPVRETTLDAIHAARLAHAHALDQVHGCRPLHPARLSGAQDVFTEMAVDAYNRHPADPVAARELMWGQAKRDSELLDALVRLAIFVRPFPAASVAGSGALN